MAKIATLSERKAWLLLAELVERTGGGLCSHLRNMEYARQISWRTMICMLSPIDKLPPGPLLGFKWPLNETGRQQRAAWCREQAAKCER